MTPSPETNGATHARGNPALPTIRIRTGFPHEAMAAAIEALRSDDDLFTRDTDLVHVTRVSAQDQEDSAHERPNGEIAYGHIAGTPKIHTMSLATLRVRMCQFALWERAKMTKEGVEIVPCEPTRVMAEEVRDGKDWPGLRELTGISETPFPRPDCVIVQGRPHYDARTGYLYQPSQSFPLVADAPTHADAIRARKALEDIFVDFPFASPAGVSACVCAAMTLVCRPAIRGPVPAWVIDATTQATGKSLLADVLAAIAFGRDSGRAHFPSVEGRDGDAEIGKRLGTFARMGLPMVNFDNADDSMIGGDVLEEVISAPDKYTFRILGKTEGFTLPMRMCLFFTGNNATWSRGMNRRILHVRLESTLENPEQRPPSTYSHPERAGRLFEYVLEHRAEYVHHILTIIRAYAAATFPDRLSLGTFEAWARLIPSAIVWAGGVNPMLCRPSMSGEESPDTLQRQTLAREWAAFCRAAGMVGISAHDLVERLYPQLDRGEQRPPDWEQLRGAIEHFVPPRPGQTPDAGKLGNVIARRFRGAPLRTHNAPAPLQRFAVEGLSGGRARWKIEPVHGGAVDAPPRRDPAVAPTATPQDEADEPAASSADRWPDEEADIERAAIREAAAASGENTS